MVVVVSDTMSMLLRGAVVAVGLEIDVAVGVVVRDVDVFVDA